jgi:hypothetical protein
VTFLNLTPFARTATKSSMTSSQCPADMKAARQSFAQESVWQTILQCGINLRISQRAFSLLSHEHLSGWRNRFYCNNSGIY